jgi:hypothetical protein
MLVTVEEWMYEEMPGVGRCQLWEDAMCGNIPRILCQMCYHYNGQTSARGAVRFGSRKYLLFIFRSQTNYTTNRFSELNISGLIHCTDDGERSTSRTREGSRCPLNRRMGSSQSRSGPFGKKKLSPFRVSNPGSFKEIAQSVCVQSCPVSPS